MQYNGCIYRGKDFVFQLVSCVLAFVDLLDSDEYIISIPAATLHSVRVNRVARDESRYQISRLHMPQP
jgi:hypothetical protein